jgi:hypothetical protein
MDIDRSSHSLVYPNQGGVAIVRIYSSLWQKGLVQYMGMRKIVYSLSYWAIFPIAATIHQNKEYNSSVSNIDLYSHAY